MPSVQEFVTNYQGHGYSEIATDSGTGSTILINLPLSRVVKINWDRAYDIFALFAAQTQSPHLPKIHLHSIANESSAQQFSVIEMELLEKLNAEEEQAIAQWVPALCDHLKVGGAVESAPDPIGLNSTFAELRQLAVNKSVGLDILKLSNYMARIDPRTGSRELVFTDPFN